MERDFDAMLTLHELADSLGVSPHQVERLIADRRLVAQPRGDERYAVHLQDVQTLKDELDAERGPDDRR
ncbi:MAG TPA: hypothetical protein VFL91_22315 [Thermomicrobiales bacterium]|nr:hypothetical protein [Thermomicrobiales bacterium]